ncbi:hydroxysqualene dehydroxylase [Sandaracinus amylolyticus]|nr:FAD-dependent oxidoreductase [Sandaracinus amylolyticus]
MTKVVILGGGVAGMSAAHELAERGLDVEVHEMRAIAGGKARSIWVPGSGTGGRHDLPGEHGFRFFPGFYRHLPDTMRRIPFPGNVNGVADNLVQATRFQIARDHGDDPVLVARFPRSLDEWYEAVRAILEARLGIPPREAIFFAIRILELLTSCDERRLGELEKVAWWDFTQAARMSLPYRTYLVIGLTRSLVAMRAEEGSTRTVGTILIQLLLDLLEPEGTLDRLLSGPTSEVWLEPWRAHLASLGVAYHTEHEVVGIDVAGGGISSVTIEKSDGTTFTTTGDYYVSCLPVERMVALLTPAMIALDPGLDLLRRLQTEWMNGIQFFLADDVPLVHGHTIYADSPWALTSISQAQFWRRSLSGYGDGTIRGVLSVDVSDWETPGILFHKPAKELATKDEVKDEVWAQVLRSFSPEVASRLSGSMRSWFLDDSIVWPNPNTVENLEPLLVNTIDSWRDRPESKTRIPNLFLASDYVRTHTDLATMEAANEAARRATNHVLDAIASPGPRCGVWPLEEPACFVPFKVVDQWRYRQGRPNLFHRCG